MITHENIWAALKDAANNGVWPLVGDGAPTNGTSGTGVGLAGPGSSYLDYTNKVSYMNTGTKASPVWTVLGGQSSYGSNNNVIGSIPVVHRVIIVAGALGDTDVVLTHKTRVIDAWLVLTGAGVATTTLTVKNGATAITDAMAASGADKALVRAATIDDAQHEIAAGGTLRVTSLTGATQPNAIVYVLGTREL